MRGLALVPLTLPALGLAGLLCIGANPVIDMQWGTMQDQPYGSMPNPGDVSLLTLGRDCVDPADATLEHLAEMIVADLDGSNVRFMPFDAGWAASEAGTVQVVLTCT